MTSAPRPGPDTVDELASVRSLLGAEHVRLIARHGYDASRTQVVAVLVAYQLAPSRFRARPDADVPTVVDEVLVMAARSRGAARRAELPQLIQAADDVLADASVGSRFRGVSDGYAS